MISRLEQAGKRRKEEYPGVSTQGSGRFFVLCFLLARMEQQEVAYALEAGRDTPFQLQILVPWVTVPFAPPQNMALSPEKTHSGKQIKQLAVLLL